MRSRILKGAFPALDDAVFQLTSPQTPVYNCIAYAAGDQHRWWWPDPDGISFWPNGVQRAVRLPAFQHAFESLGYSLSADVTLVSGVEKIALFASGSIPTHAAKQMPNGSWSSKLGRLEDIAHNLLGIENAIYGKFAFAMERKTRG